MPTKKKRVADPAPLPDAHDIIAPFYSPQSNGAHTLMWVGVISCAAMIVLLWGWALTLRVSAISWHATDENKFVTEAKQNWDGTFAAEQAKQSPLASVRSAINALVAKMTVAASTTNASSTTTTL